MSKSEQMQTDFGFAIRLLTKDDYNIAVEFVQKHYTLKDPLRQMITRDVQQCYEMDKERIPGKLQESVSFGIFNNSGTLVAATFPSVLTRNSTMTKFEAKTKQYSWLKIISKLVYELEGNLINELNTEKIFKLSMLAVDENYQRRGLATMLLRRCEEAAVDLKCNYIVVDASSYYTQIMLEKLAYKKLKEINYEEHFHAHDFNPNPPHVACVVYYKQIHSS